MATAVGNYGGSRASYSTDEDEKKKKKKKKKNGYDPQVLKKRLKSGGY